jgi:formate hydrogenlyase transcriptional activator
MVMADVEREHLLRSLELTRWRIRGKDGAAAVLDLKPTTLEARIAKLGIQRPGKESNLS